MVLSVGASIARSFFNGNIAIYIRHGEWLMKELPVRKNIRLKDYNYSNAGMYYVTICTQDKEPLFGDVVGADSISARVILNDAGKMIDYLYQETMQQFQNVTSAAYIVMPNHFHGIIAIERADMESAPTLPIIIQSFKRNTTIEYIKGVKSGIYPPFNKRIWQRNYFERVIRDEAEYQRICRYIDENPDRWAEDEYYTK